MTAAKPRRRGVVKRALRRRGLLSNRLLRALRKVTQSLPTRGNQVEVFHDGDQLFAAMLRDIRAAESTISLEMYMFLSDRVGWRFAQALADRSKRGVEVRVVYDALGSMGISSDMLKVMTDAGVAVLDYHPVAPWRRRFALFRRNHRKVLTVDGRIGYVGGVNLADAWAGRRRGGANWRDTHMRVVGPAAGDLELLFIDTWFEETGEVLPLPPRSREMAEPEDGTTDDPGQQVYVIGGVGGPKRRIRRLYLIAMGHARRRIVIANSYFVPDRKFRKALAHARRRGLQVQLLLPLRSDVRVALLASQALYTTLLKSGIEIYLWRPTILHSKYAVIDDEWWTVGSSNLDHLSFHRNREANAVVLDGASGHDLSARFARDLRFAERIHLAQWRRRPLHRKLLEKLAFLFSPWL